MYGQIPGRRTRYEVFGGSELNELVPGGEVIQFTASGTLLVGDLVYFSAASTVAKSNNTANHTKIAGVVVGGQSTDGAIIDEETYVGITAATDGQTVLVLVRGLAYVKGAAAIAAGLPLVADTTTAGRVKAATDFAVTAPTIGTITVSAPTIGTLDATVDAGAVAVTSSAANGAIATVVGAPGGGVLSGAPAGGVLSGEGNARIIGKAIEACSGAADVFLAWIRI